MKTRYTADRFPLAGLASLGLWLAAAAPAAAQTCPPFAAQSVVSSGAVLRYLAADALEGRRAGSAGERCAGAYLAAAFRALGLEPAGENGTYFQDVALASALNPHGPGGMGRNVLALLRGSDPARQAEAVVIGAHYDHLGRGPFGSLAPDSAGAIHNGADDNASGVTALLLSAQQLVQGPRLARPIVFAAFTGEELGLLGSAHYARAATTSSQMRAMLNLDMVGRLGAGPLLVFGSETAAEWEELLQAAAAPAGIALRASGDGFGSSDHTSFYLRDIPVLHFFTNVHADYHRPSDDWEKIDTVGVERIALLVARLARELAAREAPLTFQRTAVAASGRAGPGSGAYLGTVPDFTPVPRGVRLSAVRPGSPAERAGLRAGDVIVGLAAREIANLQAYSDALRAHRPGETVQITVLRDGAPLTLTATLGSRQERSPAQAQPRTEPLPPFSAAEFEARRARILDDIGDGLAVLLGEPPVTTHRRFLQEHNFFYLTGAEAPDAAVILDGRRREAILFLPRVSAQTRQWEGPWLAPGPEATRVTGIRDVRPREDFDAVLRRLLGERDVVYLQHAPPEPPPTSPHDAQRAWHTRLEDPWRQQAHANLRLVELVRQRFPRSEVHDLSPLLFAARWVKSPLEQEYLRRAGLLGALGVAEAIRSTRPGYYEWEVAAAATFVYDALGQKAQAFAPILASGPNVNTIHHTSLDRRIEASDLVLLDYGADYGYYTSDVTRTWGAAGTFTVEQLEYYGTVVIIRDSVLAALRPGVTLPELLRIAQRVTRARGHERVAWTTTRNYLGHFVGLAVHDPAPADAGTRPFVAGVVFNLEPIIDMPERGWHFRLEDTVLITESGHEVLSAAAPVAPEALAQLYAQTGVLEWWRDAATPLLRGQ